MVPIIIMIGLFGMLYLMNKKSSVPIDIPNNSFLVDVRTAKEFSGGSAPGAVNIPLGQVASQIDQFKDKGSIVVFCRTGNRSGRAKSILEEQGIENVINGGSWGNVKRILES